MIYSVFGGGTERIENSKHVRGVTGNSLKLHHLWGKGQLSGALVSLEEKFCCSGGQPFGHEGLLKKNCRPTLPLPTERYCQTDSIVRNLCWYPCNVEVVWGTTSRCHLIMLATEGGPVEMSYNEPSIARHLWWFPLGCPWWWMHCDARQATHCPSLFCVLFSP